MIKIFRNIAVAFSMYSRIPMPIFEWKEDDTKYAIAFLPWIGLVIGGVEYGLYLLSTYFDFPMLVRIVLWAFVPLFITGGFHVDGYMDVMDALKSFKSKEEKLEILKDPHIGAFSVISLVMYGLLYLGAADLLFVGNKEVSMLPSAIMISVMSFFVVRALGALLSVTLPLAKKNGMLHEETKSTNKGALVFIIIELVIGLGACAYFDWLLTIIVVAVLGLFVLWFRSKCNKEFGGITGDTIGFFITQGELLVLLAAGVFAFVGR